MAPPNRPRGSESKAVTPPAESSAAPRSPADRKPFRRRDATGHLDPTYAADLLARSGEPNGAANDRAFFRGAHSNDDLAEQLGEDFVAAATSGRDVGQERLDQEVPEEEGGPFVETTGKVEFARGTDASNPRSAEREPFPTT